MPDLSNYSSENPENTEAQFMIQRIYLKDSSFEAPNTPTVFQHAWEPEVTLDLQCGHSTLAEGLYEVGLNLSVKVLNKTVLAFLVEIKQAGIFQIIGLNQEQLRHMLGCFCPNILFPYARHIISSQVTDGGFPPLILAPVNFDALYRQQVAQTHTLVTQKTS